MLPEVGAIAPTFTLLNEEREPLNLQEVLKSGPALLAFMPAAFSRVCTLEVCTLRDGFDEFSSLGVTILGITTDTFFSLKAWRVMQKINFPLLSDFNKEVIAKYGVLDDDLYGMRGTAKRALFLIDQKGIIRYREVSADVRLEPDYSKLKDAIRALRIERITNEKS